MCTHPNSNRKIGQSVKMSNFEHHNAPFKLIKALYGQTSVLLPPPSNLTLIAGLVEFWQHLTGGGPCRNAHSKKNTSTWSRR